VSTKAVRVIGIGSPFGGDRAGWDVAEALDRRPPPGVALRSVLCRAPAAELAAQLRGAGLAVMIDAVQDGREPGTVSTLDAAALRTARRLSGHGVGVAEVLALLAALEELPSSPHLLSVSVADDGRRLGAVELERAVAAARRQLQCIVTAAPPAP
jgi:hydrogenase maturation protease